MNYSSNNLAKSPSLYLQQHAKNPVHWQMWSEDVLQHAQSENRLLVVSVGYSSCHWCHVMEHESFENDSVAAIMNTHYVSIKIDREERPDLDARFMSAVQLMTGQGGWPLNVIALPDGTPVWGGTYFSKDDWSAALSQIAQMWQDDPEKVRAYADELRKGLAEMVQVSSHGASSVFTKEDLADVWLVWKRNWDTKWGGGIRAPKFPMPTNYRYLLDYGVLTGDSATLDYVHTTLERMAIGGMYDFVGGGFTRYSTDRFWKVPHFEKMLYDNGQLLDLYARALRHYHNAEFTRVIETTSSWLVNEMKLSNGLYAAALDADSPTPEEPREEGGYYTWTLEELASLDLQNFNLFKAYFDIYTHTAWEGKYILHRTQSDSDFSQEHSLEVAELLALKGQWSHALSQARALRTATHPAPTRDPKALTTWNALLVRGWAECHFALPQDGYDTLAIELISSMEEALFEGNELRHQSTNNVASGHAFLDDHASMGLAFLSVYTLTADSRYLIRAQEMANKIIETFNCHPESPFFYYTSGDAPEWERNLEIEDNVIPSSNALTAELFLALGDHLEDSELQSKGLLMVEKVHSKVFRYGQNFSHWLTLALRSAYSHRELAVVGEEAHLLTTELTAQRYLPNTTLAWTDSASDLPLFTGRFSKQTMFYLCQGKSCQMPTSLLADVIDQWNRGKE